jgi:predicted DNA-binding protein YlxM (UPF0122 family)
VLFILEVREMAVGKYDTHVKPKLLLIEAWCRDGLIMDEIAKNLDIAKSTFFEYIKQYPELSNSIKRNKEEADVVIENELYEKAKGKVMLLNKVKVLNDGTCIDYKEEVYIPGDTTAQIFWLKNRKPKEWRDRQELEHSGNVGVNIVHNIPRNK